MDVEIKGRGFGEVEFYLPNIFDLSDRTSSVSNFELLPLLLLETRLKFLLTNV